MKNLVKFFKYCWLILNNEIGSSSGGGGAPTTVVEQPEPTEQERELQEAQLEQSRAAVRQAEQQTKMMGKFAPMFEEQLEMQTKLAQQQAGIVKQQVEAQKLATQKLVEALSPTEAQLLNEELENELLDRQLRYARGEMPDLTPQQQTQLDELSNLQAQEAFEDIEQGRQLGFRGAKDIALARGMGSSSIRDALEDEVNKQALTRAGQAIKGIEGSRFQAAWNLPQAQQGFETGMSDFQRQLNQQAEANKQQLYGNLMQGGLTGGAGGVGGTGGYGGGLTDFMNSQIPGTYFGGETPGGQTGRSGEGGLFGQRSLGEWFETKFMPEGLGGGTGTKRTAASNVLGSIGGSSVGSVVGGPIGAVVGGIGGAVWGGVKQHERN
jgi:hypothetical protein